MHICLHVVYCRVRARPSCHDLLRAERCRSASGPPTPPAGCALRRGPRWWMVGGAKCAACSSRRKLHVGVCVIVATSTPRSASSSWHMAPMSRCTSGGPKHIGGLITSTLSAGPSIEVRMQ